jgi:excisionase family DNA binding protein
VKTNDTDKKPKRGLSVRETAAELGISIGQTYEAVRTGQLPHVRIGGRIIIPVMALDRKLAGEKL